VCLRCRKYLVLSPAAEQLSRAFAVPSVSHSAESKLDVANASETGRDTTDATIDSHSNTAIPSGIDLLSKPTSPPPVEAEEWRFTSPLISAGDPLKSPRLVVCDVCANRACPGLECQGQIGHGQAEVSLPC
jgi:hypothetical protein